MRVTSQIFTGIGRSRVPVLLPFDTAAFLEARLNGAPSSLSLARYQADFRPADMFDAGPAGYDAVFSLDPGAGDGMPQRIFAKPVEVQITGSDPDLRPQRSPGRQGRAGQVADGAISGSAPFHPGRLCALRLHAVRRCPMWCRSSASNSTPRTKRLACREAYPVAERFLKALRIAGGLPSRPRKRHSLRRRNTADRARRRFHLSSRRRHHRQFRQSQAERPRRPDRPTRRSGFRWKKPRPSSARSRSAGAAGPDSRSRQLSLAR